MLKRLLVGILISAGMAGIYLIAENYFLKNDYAQLGRVKENLPKWDELHFVDLNGAVILPSIAKDKIVILNFWASWCQPCAEEVPSLKNLISEMKGDVLLVAVSVDENWEAMQEFIKRHSLKQTGVFLTWDPKKEIATKFGTQKLPESFIYDLKGRVAKQVMGSRNWSNPQLVNEIKDLVVRIK